MWQGKKAKEEQDRKWAEDKLKLLRAERNALKEGSPSEAKKFNYQLKLHEKVRPIPDTKRKDVDKSGSSPNTKVLKTNSSMSFDSKQSLVVEDQCQN